MKHFSETAMAEKAPKESLFALKKTLVGTLSGLQETTKL